MRLVSWSCAVVLTLLGAASVSDLIDFMRAPKQYPIGAEQAGISYQSAGAFILTNVIEVVLAALGLFLSAAVRSDSTKLALRVVSALAILGFTVLRIATIE